jgi:hypothetical protein
LQLTLFCITVVIVNPAVCVMVTVAVALHVLASFTVTLYVPTVKPLAVAVVLPLLQLYVYGWVPYFTPTLALPLLVNPQDTSAMELLTTLSRITGGCDITKVRAVVHPWASFTDTT